MPSLTARGWRFGMACVVVLAASGASGASIDREKLTKVKAAWLKNIAAMTTWPDAGAGAENGNGQGAPIVIGGIGRDPNGVLRIVRRRIQSGSLEAQGRALQLVELVLPQDNADPDTIVSLLEACDLLFLSEGTQAEWSLIQPHVADMPIVTVSEFEGFASRGGVIEYFLNTRSGRVSMIVNMEAMKRAGVVLSARLLSLSSVTILRPERRKETGP